MLKKLRIRFPETTHHSMYSDSGRDAVSDELGHLSAQSNIRREIAD